MHARYNTVRQIYRQKEKEQILMNKIKVLSNRRPCYVKRQETSDDAVANYLSLVRYTTPSSGKENIQNKSRIL